jgi:hypothetical protein
MYFRTAVLKASSYGMVRHGTAWYGMVRPGTACYDLDHGWSLAGTFGQWAGLTGSYFVSFPRYELVLGEILCTHCSRNNTRVVMVDTWTINGCFMQNSIFGDKNRKF